MAARFAYVLNNSFKFPNDIKHDIVYCQRALKAHIKVHQMIVDNFCPEEDNPEHKRKILDELESEIYEINAEQQYLFLRLRRIIAAFYKSLQRDGIPIDQDATNQLVSKEIISLVSQENFDIIPTTVRFRNQEIALISKYFVVDSVRDIPEKNSFSTKKSETQCALLDEQQIKHHQKNNRRQPVSSSADNFINSSEKNSMYGHTQVSLLKPISERVASSKSLRPIAVIDLDEIEDRPPTPLNVTSTAAQVSSSPDDVKETKVVLPVSKNVKLSRMNLRQALKKAKTENLAAKAASVIIPSHVEPSSVRHSNTYTSVHVVPTILKSRTAKKKSNNKPDVVAKQEDPNLSSSEESSGVCEIPNTDSSQEQFKTNPSDYDQADFLRFFNLFTPEQILDLNIRRSKRKRRGAHNNERADFHYGKFDITVNNQREKKKGDAKKKRTLTKSAIIDRSSSSSPEEHRNICNECMKPGKEETDECRQCKGYFHKTCHIQDTEGPCTSQMSSLCPACARLEKKNESKNTLEKKNCNKGLTLLSQYRRLGLQLAKEKHRRNNLQHKSKLYKIQMQNLFKIVHSFKSDQENDESTE